MGRKIISGHNGKRGRIFVNGTEICVENWESVETAEEEDVTNTCSADIDEFEYGSVTIEITASGTWDAQENHYEDPPNLRTGQKYPALFYLHASPGDDGPDGPHYQGEFGIRERRNTVPAKGKVTFQMAGKLMGTVKYPIEEVSSSGA